MKRSTLTGMGLEKDQIDAIMAEHGATVEALKEKHGDAVEALKEQLKEVKAQLPDDKTDWKQKYDDEVKAHGETKTTLESDLETERAAHGATRDTYKAKEDAASTDVLVADLLKQGRKDGEKTLKMSDAAIIKAVKDYDRTLVKRDEKGNITNADEVWAHFASEWSDFVGEVKVEGADVGRSTGGGDTGTQPKNLKEALSQKYGGNNQ